MTAELVPCIRITCNLCGERKDFIDAQTVDECRDKLHLRGWDFIASMSLEENNGQKDICPNCREELQ